jgi:hypothetical protein
MRSFLAALLLAVTTSAAFATPAADLGRLPRVEAALIQVQSRSCRACRNSCSIDRRYCGYSNYCRAEFVACMRICWEDVCRR